MELPLEELSTDKPDSIIAQFEELINARLLIFYAGPFMDFILDTAESAVIIAVIP